MKKRKAAEKTLNPESLAAGGDEGSSTTPVEAGYTDSVADFVTKNYQRLSGWCHSRWNGSGEDVMHSAVTIALERGYEHINFSLFSRLCSEAARNLNIHRWRQDDKLTIILPPTQRAAERIDAHLAVAPATEQPNFPADCIFAAKKLVRLEKKGQLNFWSGGAR